jgi:hypothetical protein
MYGDLDTTDTAGVTARMGNITQVSSVFALADAVDRARLGTEQRAGEPLPGGPPQGLGQAPPWMPSPEAAEELARQGFAFDPQTGQVVRSAPPAAPSGAGMGVMMDVTEELK